MENTLKGKVSATVLNTAHSPALSDKVCFSNTFRSFSYTLSLYFLFCTGKKMRRERKAEIKCVVEGFSKHLHPVQPVSG